MKIPAHDGDFRRKHDVDRNEGRDQYTDLPTQATSDQADTLGGKHDDREKMQQDAEMDGTHPQHGGEQREGDSYGHPGNSVRQ